MLLNGQDGDNNTILHLLAAVPSPAGTPPIVNSRYQTLPTFVSSRSISEQSAIVIRMAHLYITLFPFVLDWPNATGKTPLHVAAQAGNWRFISLLCDFGADTDVFDSQGNTPLHFCAAYGFVDAIKILIDRGCDMAYQNRHGFTAAELAFTDSIKDMMDKLERELYQQRILREKEERRAAAGLGRGGNTVNGGGEGGRGRESMRENTGNGGNRLRSESQSTSNSLGSGLGSNVSGKSGGSRNRYFDASSMPPPPALPAHIQSTSPHLPPASPSSMRNTPQMSRTGSDGPFMPPPTVVAFPIPSRASPIPGRNSPSLPNRSDSLPGASGRISADQRPPPLPYINTNVHTVDHYPSTTSQSSSRMPAPLGIPTLAEPIAQPSMPGTSSVAMRRANTSTSSQNANSRDRAPFNRSQTDARDR